MKTICLGALKLFIIYFFCFLLKEWKRQIKRGPDFNEEKKKICSCHFRKEDFYDYDALRRRLKPGALPSVFQWKPLKERPPPKKRKLSSDSELTETASESELETIDVQDKNCKRSVKLQANLPQVCQHSFSVEQLRCMSSSKNKLFKFYTGFKTYEDFMNVLSFLVPNLERKHLRYYDPRAKGSYTNVAELFDSDKKLRLGLNNVDLATRFQCSSSTVSKLLTTWVNYLYLRLGSLKIWPHRDVILANMPEDFKNQYGRTMIIIDCLELKLQTPSSRVRQSQTYSDYKSANTLKCLIGVDANGGIMFVSHLYTGRISDKEICERSGFFALLKRKLEYGELQPGDAVMADRGFSISDRLIEMELELNIPPFLHDRPRFSAEEVIRTQTIAHHRIHVERAIGKVKNFSIFERRIRLKGAHLMNQLWSVCSLLSNFQDPIL